MTQWQRARPRGGKAVGHPPPSGRGLSQAGAFTAQAEACGSRVERISSETSGFGTSSSSLPAVAEHPSFLSFAIWLIALYLVNSMILEPVSGAGGVGGGAPQGRGWWDGGEAREGDTEAEEPRGGGDGQVGRP